MRILISLALSLVTQLSWAGQIKWCYDGRPTKFKLYVDCSYLASFRCQRLSIIDTNVLTTHRMSAPLLPAGKHIFAISAVVSKRESRPSRAIRVKYCYKTRGGQPQLCVVPPTNDHC
jgi:hypothetical protein